ncbi:MAG: hypothetical protein ACE141_17005 [Bryobacteraceae bacterium]
MTRRTFLTATGAAAAFSASGEGIRLGFDSYSLCAFQRVWSWTACSGAGGSGVQVSVAGSGDRFVDPPIRRHSAGQRGQAPSAGSDGGSEAYHELPSRNSGSRCEEDDLVRR